MEDLRCACCDGEIHEDLSDHHFLIEDERVVAVCVRCEANPYRRQRIGRSAADPEFDDFRLAESRLRFLAEAGRFPRVDLDAAGFGSATLDASFHDPTVVDRLHGLGRCSDCGITTRNFSTLCQKDAKRRRRAAGETVRSRHRKPRAPFQAFLAASMRARKAARMKARDAKKKATETDRRAW